MTNILYVFLFLGVAWVLFNWKRVLFSLALWFLFGWQGDFFYYPMWDFICLVLAISLLFSCAGSLFNRLGLKTILENIDIFIGAVMRGGFDGVRLRLKRTQPKRFIEFTKRIPKNSPTEFHLVLDSRYCSEAEFSHAQKVLGEASLNFTIEKDKPPSLVVDCGQDVEKATQAAQTILQRVFAVTPESTLRAVVNGSLDVGQKAMRGWEQGDKLTGDRIFEGNSEAKNARLPQAITPMHKAGIFSGALFGKAVYPLWYLYHLLRARL